MTRHGTMVEVDAIIDGTLIRSVGIRLKGNSTLGAIRRSANVPATAATAPDGGESGTQNVAGAADTPPANPLMIKMRQMMGGVTAEDPSTLPLLLSFDEYFPGRSYQGRTELSIRPVAGGGASLNEALSLQLIADSDEISQKYSWISFNINEGESRTRLVLENPNQNYVSSLELGRGVLYKSRNSNSFEYHGDDPTLYVDDFVQLNAIGSRDLSPVIRFLAWLDSATDEEFDAELPNWLDTSSFAKYVVTQDLLDNFDDMAGPGRNFLFWYDLDDEKFTVVNWDMNLAMIGVGSVFDGRFPGGESAADSAVPQSSDSAGSTATDSNSPPAADSASPPKDAPPSRPGPNGRPLIFGNALKDRFMASEIFAQEIVNTRSDLLQFWFDSGRALKLLGTLSAYVPVTDHLSREYIDDQIASLTQEINGVK